VPSGRIAILEGSPKTKQAYRDTLVDAIVEKLYGTMKDFDAGRAKQAVELIVDRDTASKFRALLDDLWPRRPSDLAA
jgi:hypothetical protein